MTFTATDRCVDWVTILIAPGTAMVTGMKGSGVAITTMHTFTGIITLITHTRTAGDTATATLASGSVSIYDRPNHPHQGAQQAPFLGLKNQAIQSF